MPGHGRLPRCALAAVFASAASACALDADALIQGRITRQAPPAPEQRLQSLEPFFEQMLVTLMDQPSFLVATYGAVLSQMTSPRTMSLMQEHSNMGAVAASISNKIARLKADGGLELLVHRLGDLLERSGAPSEGRRLLEESPLFRSRALDLAREEGLAAKEAWRGTPAVSKALEHARKEDFQLLGLDFVDVLGAEWDRQLKDRIRTRTLPQLMRLAKTAIATL
mmetsp:Transcript_27715/g.75153  ORF Transcript_27715/g.75153 Transcript_27715/m.75153 type:complete len:224 (-) Transcript_27715:140-811(-)